MKSLLAARKCSKVLCGSALVLALSLVAGPQQAMAQPYWSPAPTWYVPSGGRILTSNFDGLEPKKLLGVGVIGASTANGAAVVQWTQNTSADQQRRFVYLNN